MANGSHSPSPATPMSPDSSTEFTCLVCLRNLHSCSKLGKPENCGHVFCLTCITQWGKNVNTCPVDRIKFNCIEVIKYGETVSKIHVPDHSLTDVQERDVTYCEFCNECNHEDRLLLCDGCDKGFHLECLSPPLSTVPEGDWYCINCEPIVRSQYTGGLNSSLVSLESESLSSDSDVSSSCEYECPEGEGGGSESGRGCEGRRPAPVMDAPLFQPQVGPSSRFTSESPGEPLPHCGNGCKRGIVPSQQRQRLLESSDSDDDELLSSASSIETGRERRRERRKPGGCSQSSDAERLCSATFSTERKRRRGKMRRRVGECIKSNGAEQPSYPRDESSGPEDKSSGQRYGPSDRRDRPSGRRDRPAGLRDASGPEDVLSGPEDGPSGLVGGEDGIVPCVSLDCFMLSLSDDDDDTRGTLSPSDTERSAGQSTRRPLSTGGHESSSDDLVVVGKRRRVSVMSSLSESSGSSVAVCRPRRQASRIASEPEDDKRNDSICSGYSSSPFSEPRWTYWFGGYSSTAPGRPDEPSEDLQPARSADSSLVLPLQSSPREVYLEGHQRRGVECTDRAVVIDGPEPRQREPLRSRGDNLDAVNISNGFSELDRAGPSGRVPPFRHDEKPKQKKKYRKRPNKRKRRVAVTDGGVATTKAHCRGRRNKVANILRKRTKRRRRKIVLKAKHRAARDESNWLPPFGGFVIAPDAGESVMTRARARTVATHSPFLFRHAAIEAGRHASPRDGLRIAQAMVNKRGGDEGQWAERRFSHVTSSTPPAVQGRSLATPMSGYSAPFEAETHVTPGKLRGATPTSHHGNHTCRELSGSKREAVDARAALLEVARCAVPRKLLPRNPPPPSHPPASEESRRGTSLLDEISHGLDVLGSRRNIIRRDGSIEPLANPVLAPPLLSSPPSLSPSPRYASNDLPRARARHIATSHAPGPTASHAPGPAGCSQTCPAPYSSRDHLSAYGSTTDEDTCLVPLVCQGRLPRPGAARTRGQLWSRSSDDCDDGAESGPCAHDREAFAVKPVSLNANLAQTSQSTLSLAQRGQPMSNLTQTGYSTSGHAQTGQLTSKHDHPKSKLTQTSQSRQTGALGELGQAAQTSQSRQSGAPGELRQATQTGQSRQSGSSGELGQAAQTSRHSSTVLQRGSSVECEGHAAGSCSGGAETVDGPECAVKQRLQVHFNTGAITAREYQRILDRATKKARSGWVRNNSLERVQRLVDDFVAVYREIRPKGDH